MVKRHTLPASVLTGLLVIAIAIGSVSFAVARDKDSKVVVCDMDGERVSVTLDGQALTITTEDGDENSVMVVDMEQIGFMVEDAMSGVSEALQGLQMDFHMGQDNRVRMALDDESWEVDINEIMADVSVALSTAMSEIETEDWTTTRYHHDSDVTDDDLREELDDLRDEMRQLRRELSKLRQQKQD